MEPRTTEQLVADSCYRCNTVLGGAEVCPQCGRKQYRVCYCGNNIPITTAVCPHCGADWSHSHRVRRKSRRNKLSYKELARFAIGGTFVALVGASVLNVIITGLAGQSLPPDQGMPGSVAVRIVLALQTVWGGIAGSFWTVVGVAGGLGPILTVAVVGCTAGIVVYLVRSGVVRVRWLHKRHKSRRRAE